MDKLKSLKELIKALLGWDEFWGLWLEKLDKDYPEKYYSEKSREKHRLDACGNAGICFLVYQLGRIKKK